MSRIWSLVFKSNTNPAVFNFLWMNGTDEAFSSAKVLQRSCSCISFNPINRTVSTKRLKRGSNTDSAGEQLGRQPTTMEDGISPHSAHCTLSFREALHIYCVIVYLLTFHKCRAPPLSILSYIPGLVVLFHSSA